MEYVYHEPVTPSKQNKVNEVSPSKKPVEIFRHNKNIPHINPVEYPRITM
jgi:hypothetical protein